MKKILSTVFLFTLAVSAFAQDAHVAVPARSVFDG
jgi:hypothetical protein